MEEEKDLIKRVDKKTTKKTYIIIAIIIVAIIALDQITKFIAIKVNYVDVIPNFLNIHIAENTKGTYGIGSSSTLSYVLTNFIVVAVLLKFITSQNEFIDTRLRIFLSLIIAGGISNTIDRIFRGFVVEFIDFNLLPVINIADIFIVIGWVSFIAIFTVFSVNEIRANKDKKKTKLEDKDKEKSKLEDKDKEK